MTVLLDTRESLLCGKGLGERSVHARPHYARRAEGPAGADRRRDGRDAVPCRLQPDDRRSQRCLSRHLSRADGRDARAGQVGAADLRRRDGVRHARGDREVPRRDRRRRVRVQRSLSRRYPSVGHAADPAVLPRGAVAVLAGQRRALARCRGRRAGQLQSLRHRVFPGGGADPAGAAVRGGGGAPGHHRHHPRRLAPARFGVRRP